MTETNYPTLRKGLTIEAPTGSRWTVVKPFTYGNGGATWWSIRSTGGRTRNVLPSDLLGWHNDTEEHA